MLTLEQEEVRHELRRELILLLHVSREEYAGFPQEEVMRGALRDLEEVRSELLSISQRYAALKLSVPPLLPSERLRGVLSSCLKKVFGQEIGMSIRVPVELAETLEAARNLIEDMEGGTEAVLCFTDEAAVGELTLHLYDLKDRLQAATTGPLESAFPLNHYDVLCLWKGSVDGVVWGPEAKVSGVYEDLRGGTVTATARTLRGMEDLLVAFGF